MLMRPIHSADICSSLSIQSAGITRVGVVIGQFLHIVQTREPNEAQEIIHTESSNSQAGLACPTAPSSFITKLESSLRMTTACPWLLSPTSTILSNPMPFTGLGFSFRVGVNPTYLNEPSSNHNATGFSRSGRVKTMN